MANKNNNRGVGNRNADWKSMIDSRVSSGGQLGLSYLQGLASQYGVPYDQIVGFVNKSGYTLGEKAAAAAQPAAQAPAFNPGQYDSLKIKDAGVLEKYLNTQLNPADIKSWQPGVNEKNVPGLDMLADYMGVEKINSQKEIKQALNILGGMQSPLPAAKAKQAGITNYNSVNDYLKVMGGGIGSPSKASSASGSAIDPSAYGGSGMGGGGMTDNYSPEMPTMPEAPEFKYTPGGPGASVDAGATGFRRKRSSARVAGLTTKGTGQFKITGQTAKSSGLNIGL